MWYNLYQKNSFGTRFFPILFHIVFSPLKNISVFFSTWENSWNSDYQWKMKNGYEALLLLQKLHFSSCMLSKTNYGMKDQRYDLSPVHDFYFTRMRRYLFLDGRNRWQQLTIKTNSGYVFIVHLWSTSFHFMLSSAHFGECVEVRSRITPAFRRLL